MATANQVRRLEELRVRLQDARRLVFHLERRWVKANRKVRGKWSTEQ